MLENALQGVPVVDCYVSEIVVVHSDGGVFVRGYRNHVVFPMYAFADVEYGSRDFEELPFISGAEV